MRIESVTPKRRYTVLLRDRAAYFSPGEQLRVVSIRSKGNMEFLRVHGRGIEFEIPSWETTTLVMEEMA